MTDINFIDSHKFEDYEFLQLSINLRNSKEIAKKAKSVAEEYFYKYADGLL